MVRLSPYAHTSILERIRAHRCHPCNHDGHKHWRNPEVPRLWGCGHPTPVLCDNLATVLLSENNTTSKRMKHIATRIAFLRENVEARKVMLIHVSTTEQIADIFTKPLSATPFHALREMMVRHPTEGIT